MHFSVLTLFCVLRGSLTLSDSVPLTTPEERKFLSERFKDAALPPVDLIETSFRLVKQGFKSVKDNQSEVWLPEFENIILRDSVFWPQAQATGDVCSLPEVIGTGPYRIPRWNFNSEAKKCELYYYSGCCGNGNNFPTPEACQVLCEVDPCTQKRDAGVGSLQIRRFYFNEITKLCEEFVYFGSGGNRNNYATLESCRATCPESPNPCAFGDPMHDGNNNVLQCGFSLVVTNACPENYYCHVGASPSTTLCCPVGNQAQCEQPSSEGRGGESLNRWYYDSIQQQCRQYSYRGLQGNQNNFLSHADCENACFTNPCLNDIPYRRAGQFLMCSAVNPAVCPDNYFCHIGSDSRTSLCCKRQGNNPCMAPMIEGVGNNQLVRWYYEPNRLSCDRFLYRGQRGNENSFFSQSDCQRECPIFKNPCSAGAAARDTNGRPEFCGRGTNCSAGYYCHFGASEDSTVCCPSLGSPCALKKSNGFGAGSLDRYFFDQLTRSCKQFSYRGTMGNDNNFMALEPCERECPVFRNPCLVADVMIGLPRSCVTSQQCAPGYWCHVGATRDLTVCCRGNDSPCQIPRLEGSGNANLDRFYFDEGSRSCIGFTYRGMHGNQNNFATKATCESTCPTWKNVCPKGQPLLEPNNKPSQCSERDQCPRNFFCHIGRHAESTMCCLAGDDACTSPVANGEGIYALPRWFFDPASKSCKSFSFRGSKGNENNFLKQADCEQRCPVWKNPCWNSQPLLDQISSLPVECDSLDPEKQCPLFHWCHTGADLETTICCSGKTDPCQFAMSEGKGSHSLDRYYFNFRSRSCAKFKYKGLFGNQNNFVTLQQCEQVCPVFRNPCPQPMASADVTFCSSATMESCPPTYWCHIGNTDDTSTCCPGAVNPCSERLIVGTGAHSLSRWFFDNFTRQCKQFQYSGMGGNQNNFITKEACEAGCPTWTNPCASGTPLLSLNVPQVCSPDRPCPSTHWCHVGETQELTVCCPSPQDPCYVPRIQGTGTATLSRWYFDPVLRTCLTFNYNGLNGNQNNFLAKSDCESVCPVFKNPCPLGEPLRDDRGRVQQCRMGSELCPPSFWCHFGGDLDTTVCCPQASDAPCSMPVVAGVGDFSLSRWKFNPQSLNCESFSYKGFEGNQNNFISLTDCENRCPVFRNPCAGGQPARDSSNVIQRCNVLAPSCPDGFWCQHAFSEAYTVCCPGGKDACNAPMSKGLGTTRSERWFFNYRNMQCETFTFRGTMGTPNNFVSKSLCEDVCPVFKDPCESGDAARFGSGKPRFCSEINPVCPQGYWCHFGGSSDTTVCCLGRTNPCSVTKSDGLGTLALNRFYYDASTRKCLSFVYTGTNGNVNNFLDRQSCEHKCPVFENPCPSGEPMLASNRRPVSCQFGSSNCGLNYWCHLGATSDTTVCCPGAYTPCTVYMSEGRGRETELRWYFDKLVRRCRSFVFYGLSGNQNNFRTQPQCEETCPAFQSACNGIPMTEGKGNASLERWYFDYQSKQCQSFMYRGMGGNPNNFLANSDCESTCPVWHNPCIGDVRTPQHCSRNNPLCPINQWCHLGVTSDSTVCCPNAVKNICQAPLTTGTGTQAVLRYYFDPSTRQCKQFTYRGAHGNQNNFLTLDDCIALCPIFVNPCATGRALLDPNGSAQICKFDDPIGSCPRGYWCHVGNTNDTTVCCSGARDPCQLSMAVGTGSSTLPRWYYDVARRRCSPFTYSGVRGNQNNFLDAESCRKICREFDNPCIGQPAMDEKRQVIFCSQTNRNNCPVNFWCHIGATIESTVCCPGATNPCSVPLAPGSGGSALARYYYNAESRNCIQFVYNGIGGNQNNFVSIDTCEETCPVWVNPCRVTVDGGSTPVRCSPLSPGACPEGQWCHNGATSDDQVCCSGYTEDPCNLPKMTGDGDSRLHRWYYNDTTKKCVDFLYQGRNGNQNNFGSRESCRNKCPAFNNPCLVGAAQVSNDGNGYATCSLDGTLKCQAGFYCHIGAQNNVCCRQLGNQCSALPQEGEGNSSLLRFYFSPDTEDCQSFVYKGRKGNENNFLDREQCINTCAPNINACSPPDGPFVVDGRNMLCTRGRSPCPASHYCHYGADSYTTQCCPRRGNPCQQPQSAGQGSASMQRYYFNRNKDQCESFIYGGTRGNENNFLTSQDCEKSCPGYKDYCPHARPLLIAGDPAECGVEIACPNSNYVCHINTQKSASICCPDPAWFCIVPRDPGRCTNYTTRFGYNRETGSCTPFQYGSCGGNLNNFPTLKQCTSICCDKGF